MSDPATALLGAAYSGLITVAEALPRGMVTLKADLTAATAKAVSDVTGAAMPDLRQITSGKMDVAWMAPDELLILCDHAEADAVTRALSDKLGQAHHLAINVSDARAVFLLEGDAIRDVLGKLTPADLSPGALPIGEMRRTRLAQVAAAIWFTSDTTAEVMCFRSVARYVFDVLTLSARPGSAVGFH